MCPFMSSLPAWARYRTKSNGKYKLNMDIAPFCTGRCGLSHRVAAYTPAKQTKAKERTICEIGKNWFYLVRSIDRVKMDCVAGILRQIKIKFWTNKPDRWKEDKNDFYEFMIYLVRRPPSFFSQFYGIRGDIRYTSHRFVTWMVALCNH